MNKKDKDPLHIIDENNDSEIKNLTLDSFIEKPDLINSKYLKELIILIQEDLKKEIYYKIPFLIGPNIIKLYIESNLDEK